jgi:predicted nucleic acid-binding OB-fold protein
VLPAALLFAADDAGEQLLAAARKGDVAVVKDLLDKGANVNSKNRYGSTPLFFACDRGHLEVVKLLLDRGADMNARDTFYNASPLTWAMSKKHQTIVELLIDRGVDVSDALRGAIQMGDQKTFDTIVGRGTLNKRVLDEALTVANISKREAMAKSLAATGATPLNLNVSEEIGKAMAGKYSDGADMNITMLFQEGKLMVGNSPLVPSGKDQYRLLQSGTVVNVDRGPDGAVTGVRFAQRGGEMKLQKVAAQ